MRSVRRDGEFMARTNLQGYKVGKCMNCTFHGLLRPKAMIRRGNLNAITGDTSETVPTLNVCVTCFETSAGCDSVNVTHKRSN